MGYEKVMSTRIRPGVCLGLGVSVEDPLCLREGSTTGWEKEQKRE